MHLCQPPQVLVTHPASRLHDYFGGQALAGLRQFAEVRLHPGEEDLAGQARVDAAQACSLVIAYRQTPFGAQ